VKAETLAKALGGRALAGRPRQAATFLRKIGIESGFGRKAFSLRYQLVLLRGRYDSGAITPAIFSTMKAIEREIAWLEHRP
jgi:hypothetical protein